MKHRSTPTLIILLFCIFSSSVYSQGWWFRKADYNQSSRTAAVAFAISTGVFVGTGFDSTSFRRNFSAYNPSANTWTESESMGGATGSGLSRNSAIAFSIGTKGYVGLGQGSNPFLNDLWEYDAGSDTWTQKANFGGTARRSAAGFTANNKGYVVCGQDIAGFKNDMWMYDPSANTWTVRAPFPGTARRLPVAFVVGINAYVGTGDDGVFKNDFYMYNAASNAWLSIPPFAGTPRYSATSFTIGTDGYVGTGYDNTLSNVADFWKYNTLTSTWSAVKPFSGTPRSNAVGFGIGPFGYVALGYDTLTARDLWVYDPSSNGIEETDRFQSSVKVYPNPMVDEATITFDPECLNAFAKISFEMYDLSGKRIYFIDRIENNESKLSRNDLPAGMYVYRFLGDRIPLYAGKMIVQ